MRPSNFDRLPISKRIEILRAEEAYHWARDEKGFRFAMWCYGVAAAAIVLNCVGQIAMAFL